MKARSLQLSPEGKNAPQKALKKKHLKKKKGAQKKHGQLKPKPKSPVSRFALLAVALILPIRRRLRLKLEDERSPAPKL